MKLDKVMKSRTLILLSLLLFLAGIYAASEAIEASILIGRPDYLPEGAVFNFRLWYFLAGLALLLSGFLLFTWVHLRSPTRNVLIYVPRVIFTSSPSLFVFLGIDESGKDGLAFVFMYIILGLVLVLIRNILNFFNQRKRQMKDSARRMLFMSHQEKVKYMIEDLKRQGVGPYTGAPPLWRFFWLCKLNVRPPLFMPTLQIALIMGIPYGTLLGLLFSLWGGFFAFWFTLLVGGFFFGSSMSFFLKNIKAKLNLPSWEEYPKSID